MDETSLGERKTVNNEHVCKLDTHLEGKAGGFGEDAFQVKAETDEQSQARDVWELGRRGERRSLEQELVSGRGRESTSAGWKATARLQKLGTVVS